MTCIVAVKQGNKVYMGADSCVSSQHTYNVDIDDKIYRKGDFIFGGAGSVRVKDVIQYGITIPENIEIPEVERFIRMELVPAIQEICSKNGAIVEQSGSKYSEGALLVAYKNNLWEVWGDFAVTTVKNRNYTSIGSGSDFAMGSFHSTEGLGLTPNKRLNMALEAAVAFQQGCRAPFHYLNT